MFSRFLLLLSILLLPALLLPAGTQPEKPASPAGAAGWTAAAPRDEIRPAFAFEPAGGADGKGCWLIRADRREGLHGWWTKTYPVAGGKHYRFCAFYRAAGVAVPRRSIVARVLWQDDRGRTVPLDR